MTIGVVEHRVDTCESQADKFAIERFAFVMDDRASLEGALVD
jgi:hypothetical protein